MHIVQLASFVGPRSGGIRVVLDALGKGYLRDGHDRTLVVPGPRSLRRRLPDGTELVVVPGRWLPTSGGYRLLPARPELEPVLRRLRPDALEVSDRIIPAWTCGWARHRGIAHTVIVHERLDHALRSHLPGAPRRLARRLDHHLARRCGRLVVPSGFAAAAFPDGATEIIPWGVDTAAFRPAPHHRAADAPLRLVLVSRLSREKHPELALTTLAALHARGNHVHLDVVGDGPRRGALHRLARGLPVTFHGHLARPAVAARLAAADVALATCPAETFGLGALEALASGTPIVVPTQGALPELLGLGQRQPAVTAAGAAASAQPAAFRFAVERLLAIPEPRRRDAARDRARRYPWASAIHRLLDIHTDGGKRAVPAGATRHLVGA